MLFAEQVEHHPPVTAMHAISKKYEIWSSNEIKSKFTGASMTLKPVGLQHVKLLTTGEHFTYHRPETMLKNIMIGTLYMDIDGETTIVNHQTGDYCKFKFHPQGWGGRNA